MSEETEIYTVIFALLEDREPAAPRSTAEVSKLVNMVIVARHEIIDEVVNAYLENWRKIKADG